MVAIPKLDDSLEADIVRSIIAATGRDITIVYSSGRIPCPVCAGTNPFCTTCEGNPTVDMTASGTFTARVNWSGVEKKIYEPTGQSPEGDCVVTIAATASGELSATRYIVEKALHAIVDARRCIIDRWYFKGSPINRIYLVLKEDDKIGVQRIG